MRTKKVPAGKLADIRLTIPQRLYLEHMQNLRTLCVGWERGIFVNGYERDARTRAALVRKGYLKKCSVPKHEMNGFQFTKKGEAVAKA